MAVVSDSGDGAAGIASHHSFALALIYFVVSIFTGMLAVVFPGGWIVGFALFVVAIAAFLAALVCLALCLNRMARQRPTKDPGINAPG